MVRLHLGVPTGASSSGRTPGRLPGNRGSSPRAPTSSSPCRLLALGSDVLSVGKRVRFPPRVPLRTGWPSGQARGCNPRQHGSTPWLVSISLASRLTVRHLPVKEADAGSSPALPAISCVGTQAAKRPDCKSGGPCGRRRFESSPAHQSRARSSVVSVRPLSGAVLVRLQPVPPVDGGSGREAEGARLWTWLAHATSWVRLPPVSPNAVVVYRLTTPPC